MNKARLLKSTLCIASAITVMIAAKSAPVAEASNVLRDAQTTSISFDMDDTNYNSLAGISLSLDKYYTVATEETSNILEEELHIASSKSVDVAQDENAVEVAEEEKKEQIKESEYANTGISIASKYVNIRKEANTESEVVGKLYKGSAATITETKGEWVKIKSGKVVGYINAEYLAIGFSAEELVDKYATRLATVTGTSTLRLREEKSKESRTLTLIPEGETYQVLSYDKEWVEISIDDDITGFVSADFVKMEVEFEHAISTEEELEQIAREEAAKKAVEEAEKKAAEKKAAEEAKKKAEAAKKKQEQANAKKESNSNKNSSTNSNKDTSNNSSKKPSSNNTDSSKDSDSEDESTSTSGTARDVVEFALKFVGNRYVYGGQSLTNGTDCSGFTMQVYKHFGYSLPRSSSAQASSAGTKVSLSNLKVGDLIFYAKRGRVNHVAIYIGNGKVVHASNPSDGIKISKYNYRTPYMARRVIK